MRRAQVVGKSARYLGVLGAALVIVLACSRLDAAPTAEEETQDGPPGEPDWDLVPESPLPEWVPADASRLEGGMPWLARELLPGEDPKAQEGLFVLSRPERRALDDGEFFTPLEESESESYRVAAWEHGILDPRNLLDDALEREVTATLDRWRGSISHAVGVVILDDGEILPGSEEWIAAWSPAFWPRPAVVAVYSLGSPGLSRLLLVNARAGGLAALDLIEMRTAALEAARDPGSQSGGLEEYVEGLGGALSVWERKGVERREAARAGAVSRMAGLGQSGVQAVLWAAGAGLACLALLVWAARKNASRSRLPLGGLEGVEPAPPRFGGKAAGGGGAVLDFGSGAADV